MTGREFDLIGKYFAPLASAADGAFSLRDDAALLPMGASPENVAANPDAGRLVASKDILIAGVHFRDTDAPGDIARKALRVNLSDLAAMGAKPLGYMLGCAWPQNTDETYIAAFADGLRQDQGAFAIALFGGDTTVHRIAVGPLTISVTMLGAVTGGAHGVDLLKRDGAQVGDDVYLSGTVGDAALGLRAESLDLGEEDRRFLDGRYRLPTPRIDLGRALTGVASSAIDVSDGLLADAGHIGHASGVTLQIELHHLPMSPAAANWIVHWTEERIDHADGAITPLTVLASGGDDYELLFTASKTARRAVELAGRVARTPLTRIGSVVSPQGSGDDADRDETGAVLIDDSGRVVNAPARGYDHFSAAQ